MTKTIEVTIVILGKTPQALRVTDGVTTDWIPKSLIEEDTRLDSYEIGQTYEIVIPEWLALKKELI
jgi:hypothetical protein